MLLTLRSTAQPVQVAAGTVQRFERFPSQYVDARHVDVWLPEGYSPSKKYAVLYMHDGQMLFDATTTWNQQEWGVDEKVSLLIQEGKIRDCIVVGIWNNGEKRRAEYFPQKAFQYLDETEKGSAAKRLSDEKAALLADNYLRFLVTELKPFIDKTFSTIKGKKHTFIMGSSMGGLISMYALCEYPQIFGAAACLSTHWPGGLPDVPNNPVPAALRAYLQEHLPPPQKNRIYFDYGTETLDALYPPLQEKVDVLMREKGFSEKNWITRAFPGEDHSERAWNKRLEIPLVFLLGKPAKD